MPLARPAGIRVGHPHRKRRGRRGVQPATARREHASARIQDRPAAHAAPAGDARDRKSTRLNSSHSQISYAVFCLKKKKKQTVRKPPRFGGMKTYNWECFNPNSYFLDKL